MMVVFPAPMFPSILIRKGFFAKDDIVIDYIGFCFLVILIIILLILQFYKAALLPTVGDYVAFKHPKGATVGESIRTLL
jgi:hypothetical protein